ncbi:MAG: hypothetical protein HY521_06490 [Proteobacteria bacterium]|nr:hypothetical protein [Pseudomonadota bacterium]
MMQFLGVVVGGAIGFGSAVGIKFVERMWTAEALASALIGDISVSIESACRRAEIRKAWSEMLEKGQEVNVIGPVREGLSFVLYREAIPNLGFLEQPISGQVVRFFRLMDSSLRGQEALVDGTYRSLSEENRKAFVGDLAALERSIVDEGLRAIDLLKPKAAGVVSIGSRNFSRDGCRFEVLKTK